MEPVTAGLIAAAPKLLGALFGALAPKPRQPLPMAPSLMGGERLQLGGEAPQQGPTAGQLILDGLLSGGLGALGAYAQNPSTETSLLGSPTGSISPGSFSMNPSLRSDIAGQLAGDQFGSLSYGSTLARSPGLFYPDKLMSGSGGSVGNSDHTYEDFLDSQRIYGGL